MGWGGGGAGVAIGWWWAGRRSGSAATAQATTATSTTTGVATNAVLVCGVWCDACGAPCSLLVNAAAGHHQTLVLRLLVVVLSSAAAAAADHCCWWRCCWCWRAACVAGGAHLKERIISWLGETISCTHRRGGRGRRDSETPCCVLAKPSHVLLTSVCCCGK